MLFHKLCSKFKFCYYSDRFRTTINVVCDALGAIIVASLSQGDLDEEKSRAAQNDRELAPAHELTELEKGEHWAVDSHTHKITVQKRFNNRCA